MSNNEKTEVGLFSYVLTNSKTSFINEVVSDESTVTPISVSLVGTSENRYYGQTTIVMRDVDIEGQQKKICEFQITALKKNICGDIIVVNEAVRFGIKELLRYLKMIKVTSNTIFINEPTGINEIDYASVGLIIVDVLKDFKVFDKFIIMLERKEKEDQLTLLGYTDSDDEKKSSKKDSKKSKNKKKKNKKKK